MRHIVSLVLALALLCSFSVFGSGKTEGEKKPTEAAAAAKPGKYNEAPMLAELVKAGKLPPVDARVPDEPLVLTPPNPGRYGGTLQLISRYESAPIAAGFASDGLNGFVAPLPDGSGLVPHFATKIDVSSDLTTYTIHMRKGVKWSDGQPFTTEDMEFWYWDHFRNPEVTPEIRPAFKSGGEVIMYETIDDYTFRFVAKNPAPKFMAWPLSKGTQHFQMLKPKHYLKNYHIKYVDKDKLEKMTKDAGYAKWHELYLNQAREYCALPAVPGRPTVTSYVNIEWTSDGRTFERNPYYWKVDNLGNQLPFIDRLHTQYISDPEVANGKIISGEIDFNGFEISIKNYPLYKQYEEQGGYNVYLWGSGKGGDIFYYFNMTHTDDGLRAIFQDKRWRRAMSVAINRQEINEFLYYGKAVVQAYTIFPSSKYGKKEWADAYAQYDPDQAKKWLDEMGVVDKDGDGWRDRPDGSKLSFTIEFTSIEDPLKTNVTELVTEYWKKLNINASMKEISNSLYGTRQSANELDIGLWHGGWETGLLFPGSNPWTEPGATGGLWRLYTNHWNLGQDIDIPIMPEAQAIWDAYQIAINTGDMEEHIRESQKILQSQADNVWFINTIAMAPHPIIVDKNLHNVPETGLYAWEVGWLTTRNPEQWFFDEGEGKAGDK